MVASIALAGLTLRSGLALRRSRQGLLRRTPQMRPRHLRLAKPAVVMLLLGFVGGPVSSVWLRSWDAFGTFHGAAGLVAAALFAAAALLGHRIEAHHSKAFDAHALAGGFALLIGALAAVAGFILLP
jgi:polyferredoxin